MLIILRRHSSCLKMCLRWHQMTLSGPGADKLLHLLIAFLNSNLKNSSHDEVNLFLISLRILTSTWWLIVWLNMLWRAPYKLSGVMHGWPLNLIASVAGSLRLLIQFINFQGLQSLFATSWIFESKKDHLVFFMIFLNFFQFSQLLVVL